MKKFLLRHLGNMGDLVFFVPPVLETLKKTYPNCHITFVTAWGYKNSKGRWGERNQDGFSLHLLMTNPHIDELIHYHDTQLSPEGSLCFEDGQRFPTWNKPYYEQQKNSGDYSAVYELDFGLGYEDNPLQKMYDKIGLPQETYSHYQLYLTEKDLAVAAEVMAAAPHPRIVLLEGLEGTTTRGWDPEKIPALAKEIEKTFGVTPVWFGSKYPHYYQGRTLTLRENIATLTFCDVALGVLSGPLHFAAAVGLPTLTLYCDQPLHRTAPAYFLNKYITNPAKHHRTLLGPACPPYQLLKSTRPSANLTPAEIKTQNFRDWQHPGRQSTKSCLAVITVDEVMTVLQNMVNTNFSETEK
jgi:ADP-heptose:LPS heptosyltransferase